MSLGRAGGIISRMAYWDTTSTKTRHEDVRRLAAPVLGDVPDPEAARTLVAVLGDYDQELRRSAHDSLA